MLHDVATKLKGNSCNNPQVEEHVYLQKCGMFGPQLSQSQYVRSI